MRSPSRTWYEGMFVGAAVDREVAVAHQLARLGAAGGEAHPEDDVVEARLEQAQQVLAGHAGP